VAVHRYTQSIHDFMNREGVLRIRKNKHSETRICKICWNGFQYYDGNNGLCKDCKEKENVHKE